MPISDSRWIVWITAFVLASCAGCPSGSTPDGPQPPVGPSRGEATPRGNPARVESPVIEARPAEEPALPPTMPEVLLTDAERETCVIGVGDVMPEAELPDLTGDMMIEPLDAA